MPSLVRTLALGSALAILAPAGSLSPQTTDPLIGTWKLNVAKSKYNPGPLPKTVTVTFEMVGPGVKVSIKGVDAQGNPIETQYTANYDGKDYPVTGSPDYDTVSLKRIDARTVASTRKKGGKVVQTLALVLAKDGKLFTGTTKGANAKGQRINNVAVLEKQ